MTWRAVWVDAYNDANYDKLRAHGITYPYYALYDEAVTAARLERDRQAGFPAGVYAAWNWYPGVDGRRFAERVSDELKRFNTYVVDGVGYPAVCVDIEQGGGLNDGNYVAFVRAFLKRWRELRPVRKTHWTLEGFQGGLFDPDDVAAIVAANVGVVPQFYGDGMRIHWAADRVLLDLLYHGFPYQRIFGFYDAAMLGFETNWEGYAFSQGRLP